MLTSAFNVWCVFSNVDSEMLSKLCVLQVKHYTSMVLRDSFD